MLRTDRASANLLCLTVSCAVVRFRTVVHDGVYPRERVRMPRIGVRVKKDAHAFPPVHVAKDGTCLSPRFREPYGETVSEERVALAVDPEFEFDFELVRCDGESTP